MLIDFHTHIFPEKIAARTIDILKKPMIEYKGDGYVPYTEGTISSLRNSMKENNVDISVVLPVVTSEKQTESINDFAKSICQKDIISFGGIYPFQKDWEEALFGISERGLKGIKIHPELQGLYIDSPESVRILKKAEELKLYVSIHTGISIGSKGPVHCTPERLKNVLKYVSGEYIIAAHMGGWGLWDDAEKYIAGTPMFMDISFIKGYMPKEQCMRMFEKHGTEKILYGSDSPWESQSDSLNLLEKLNLTKDEFENITYKNALRILKL